MIPKALQVYATMKALWSNSYDIIEVHALLAVRFLGDSADKDVNGLSTADFKRYFEEEYGLSQIPTAGIKRIAERLVAKRLVYRKDHKYWIKGTELAIFLNDLPAAPDIGCDMSLIKQGISDLAKSEFNLCFTDIEIEKGLIYFFNKHDGEIILDGKEIKNIESIKNPKSKNQKLRFIISKYIQAEEKNHTKLYETLLAFTTGHMISSVMSMEDFILFQGKLNKLDIYIDSPIFFNLLGLNEGPFKLIATDLLSQLKESRANLKIASEHYSEIVNSIKYAISLLETEFPNLEKANRIYFYAVDNNLDANDLKLKLNQVETIIDHYAITVENCPPKYASYGTLEEDAINNAIIEVYTRGEEITLPYHRIESIRRDAKVLNLISKIRDKETATSLNRAKALLITNNLKICRAVLRDEFGFVPDTIPLCLNSETVSLILWTNNPQENSSLNKLSLACDCAKVTTIKSSLLRRFYKDVKSKFEAHAITDEEYIALMSSKLISTELQFKTFNNEDLYTDETFKDIAQRVNAQQKLEIDEFKIKDTERLNKCKLLSSKISSWIVNIIGSVFLILALVSKFWDISSNSIFQLVFGYSMVFFFTLWGILNWLKIFPTKERLHNYFENKIFDLLRRNLL